jgi:hypothetical protein
MNLKKMTQIGLIAGAALALQGCGGGSDNFFQAVNTNSGHVCVEGLDVAADSAEGQAVGIKLYAYYGYRGGEKKLYSGGVSCSNAKIIGGRDSDLTISVDFYNSNVVTGKK